MKLKTFGLSVVFKVIVATTAIGLTGVVGVTAFAAMTREEMSAVQPLRIKLELAVNGLIASNPDASEADVAALINDTLAGVDIEVANIALAAAASHLPKVAAVTAAVTTIQQSVLTAAIVQAVQEAGGNSASEAEVTATVASVISNFGTSASIVQSALASASTELKSAGVTSKAVTSAIATINTTVVTAATANPGWSGAVQTQVAGTKQTITVYVRG